MAQSKNEAERIMEQQRLGDYEKDLIEDDDPYDDLDLNNLCANCGHEKEDHVDYTEECCYCDCQKFIGDEA